MQLGKFHCCKWPKLNKLSGHWVALLMSPSTDGWSNKAVKQVRTQKSKKLFYNSFTKMIKNINKIKFHNQSTFTPQYSISKFLVKIREIKHCDWLLHVR